MRPQQWVRLEELFEAISKLLEIRRRLGTTQAEEDEAYANVLKAIKKYEETL